MSEIIEELEKANQLNNTYIFFTSDHGYHLGQYGIALDKRLPYDTDIRIPFFVPFQSSFHSRTCVCVCVCVCAYLLAVVVWLTRSPGERTRN